MYCFDFDEVEGALDVRVLLDQRVYLALQHAVGHLVCQDDLPHVDVLLVEGVVELDALQFVGAFLAFLDETVPLPYLADLTLKILVFLLSEFMVAVLQSPALG